MIPLYKSKKLVKKALKNKKINRIKKKKAERDAVAKQVVNTVAFIKNNDLTQQVMRSSYVLIAAYIITNFNINKSFTKLPQLIYDNLILLTPAWNTQFQGKLRQFCQDTTATPFGKSM